MELEFSDWENVQLKSAVIKEVENIEGKDRLYKLTVDVGEDKQRTLVGGIKPWYPADDLIGKTIIVVANLKPAKIAGIESNGMLLAIMNDEGKPVLLTTAEEIKPGKRVE